MIDFCLYNFYVTFYTILNSQNNDTMDRLYYPHTVTDTKQHNGHFISRQENQLYHYADTMALADSFVHVNEGTTMKPNSKRLKFNLANKVSKNMKMTDDRGANPDGYAEI